MNERPRRYAVRERDRAPLLQFIIHALETLGCRLIHVPSAKEAPFQITYETPTGERRGIVAYAFLANSKATKNRPDDEHRFQVKYGSKEDGAEHEIWQDPYGLYTTLFLGINPEEGFFVGADPSLHNPTKFFISLEFKQEQVDRILQTGWHAWERDRRSADEKPVEVLVGGTIASFLRYVQLERDALGEDQGHRQLLAEKPPLVIAAWAASPVGPMPSATVMHELAREFEMPEAEVLDMISTTRRLKMAVRGWVAERHLVRHLTGIEGVTDCRKIDEEGGPDVELRYRGSAPISIECKNVLRTKTAKGLVRVDFQRTRASKSDPCSRYYSPSDFDVVAACLHAVTERWEFRLSPSDRLDPHASCVGKLSQNVRLDSRWDEPVSSVLETVARRQ